MMLPCSSCLQLLLFLITPTCILCWASPLHALVMMIARQHMRSEDIDTISEVLTLQRSTFEHQSPGTMEFDTAGAWADFVTDGDTLGAIKIPQNAGQFHYTDINPGFLRKAKKTPLSKTAFDNHLKSEIFDNDHNAAYALEKAITVIQNYIPQESDHIDKTTLNLWVRYLMHILGDIHNPVHAGFCDASSLFPNGHDRGGNDWKFVSTQGGNRHKAHCLHSLWDSANGLVRSNDNYWKSPMSQTMMSFTCRDSLRAEASRITGMYEFDEELMDSIFAVFHEDYRTMSLQDNLESLKTDLSFRRMIHETSLLSLETVYKGLDTNPVAQNNDGRPLFAYPSSDYCNTCRRTAEKQLFQAGMRSAYVLQIVAAHLQTLKM